MDNIKDENTSKVIKKRRLFATYDRNEIISLFFTIIVSLATCLVMTFISVTKYYEMSADVETYTFGMVFDFIKDEKNVPFMSAYIFSALLLWFAVGFIISKLIIKFTKYSLKASFMPSTISKLLWVISVLWFILIVTYSIYCIDEGLVSFDFPDIIVPVLILLAAIIALLVVPIMWAILVRKDSNNKALTWLSIPLVAITANPIGAIYTLILYFSKKSKGDESKVAKFWFIPAYVNCAAAIALLLVFFGLFEVFLYMGFIGLVLWAALFAVSEISILTIPYLWGYWIAKVHIFKRK